MIKGTGRATLIAAMKKGKVPSGSWVTYHSPIFAREDGTIPDASTHIHLKGNNLYWGNRDSASALMDFDINDWVYQKDSPLNF